MLMPTRLTLLLVEDSEPIRSRLTEMLQSERLCVTAVATVAEAIAALADRPDVLSVDLNLPDGSGIEVIRHAKTLAKPPVVFVLTAVPEMRNDCLRCGADDVYDKSTEVAEYLRAIEDRAALHRPTY